MCVWRLGRGGGGEGGRRGGGSPCVFIYLCVYINVNGNLKEK